MGTRLRLRGGIAALIGGVLLVAGTTGVRAVMFKSTGDPEYNTNAPNGSLTNSGWQYQGSWGVYLGTPIAPTYFIAADHVGGSIGDPFTLNGFTYHTVATFNDPNSDLRIWKVDATFPIYAPLYTNSDEVGKHCVVFGRGTRRGDPVIVSGKTNGWSWGGSDNVERWGENDIATNVNGGGGLGQLLYATFDRGAGSNECHLSVGDSSGGMFITNSGKWKLAGIHYGVDTSFISTNGVNGSGFNAAMLDYGGVYIGGDGNWQIITNQMTDIVGGFYSTRISTNIAWINSVIDFQPGDDLQITAIEQAGNDMSVSFATTNRLYFVQRADDLTSGTWTTFTNNVPGTGGIVSVLDTNAASLPKRFYRVGLVQ